MPDVISWTTLDPLSYKNPHNSIYNAIASNPIMYIDRFGLFANESDAEKHRKEHNIVGTIEYDSEQQLYYILEKGTNRMIFTYEGTPSETDNTPKGIISGVCITAQQPKKQEKSSVVGWSDLISWLAIGETFAENKFEGMSTAERSRFVHRAKQFAWRSLGVKVTPKNSYIYRTLIPKTLKYSRNGLIIAAYAYTFNDIIKTRTIKASHLHQIGEANCSWIPKVGGFISASWYITDLSLELTTGKNTGDYLDEFVEYQFGWEGGVIWDF